MFCDYESLNLHRLKRATWNTGMADITMCSANTSYSINSSGKFISFCEICSCFKYWHDCQYPQNKCSLRFPHGSPTRFMSLPITL